MCSDEQPVQYLEPEACQAYLQPDNLRPFSLKHAQQQASIVGHMQQIGLLQVRPALYLQNTANLQAELLLLFPSSTCLCTSLQQTMLTANTYKAHLFVLNLIGFAQSP